MILVIVNVPLHALTFLSIFMASDRDYFSDIWFGLGSPDLWQFYCSSISFYGPREFTFSSFTFHFGLLSWEKYLSSLMKSIKVLVFAWTKGQVLSTYFFRLTVPFTRILVLILTVLAGKRLRLIVKGVLVICIFSAHKEYRRICGATLFSLQLLVRSGYRLLCCFEVLSETCDVYYCSN